MDQRLSMPLGSYELEYFDAVQSLLAVGPPVYFVVTGGHNYVSTEGQDEIMNKGTSLTTQIALASGMPNAYGNHFNTKMKRTFIQSVLSFNSIFFPNFDDK